jgi:hypothetical protein
MRPTAEQQHAIDVRSAPDFVPGIPVTPAMHETTLRLFRESLGPGYTFDKYGRILTRPTMRDAR